MGDEEVAASPVTEHPPGRTSARLCLAGLAVTAVASLLAIPGFLGPEWSSVMLGLADADAGTFLLTTLSDLVGLVVAVAYFAWSWRMAGSYLLLTGQEPLIGRVGAIVWWFVPLANLVMPAVFVADLMKGLALPGRRHHRWLIAVWWVTYVLSFAISLVWAFDTAGRLGPALLLERSVGLDSTPPAGVPLPAVALDATPLVVATLLEVVAAISLMVILVVVQRAVAERHRVVVARGSWVEDG